MISILTSYYNGERFLSSFLENYKQQSVFNQCELVFVGCLLNDNEKQILNSFKTEYPDRIKIIALDELKKQSECWNIAIKESSNEYLAIWNVDDRRFSLENQLKAFQADPKFDVVHGMFIISNRFGERYGKLIDHSIYEPKEYWESFLLGPFFMFRKSFVEKCCCYMDEQFFSGSDYEWAMRAIRNGAIIKMINSVDGYFLDERKGLSTRGDNLQPIERTVVEARWGLAHKIDSQFLLYINQYDLKTVTMFGKKYSLEGLVNV